MHSHSGQSTHITLLDRLRNRSDRDAWREFCDRYAALIRGYAKRRGLQDAECDDVLQEALLALTRSMPGFEYDPSRGRFRGYLRTVVSHLVSKRFCQKPVGSLLNDYETATESTDRDLDEDWEAEWRQYHLRIAMRVVESEFNENDRAAFDAYALAGQSAEEVATDLGLSVDQVYQSKSRITKRLMVLVAAQIEEEG